MNKLSFGILLATAPLFASAVTITDLLTDFRGTLEILYVVSYAVVILFFFWGLAKFVRAAGDENAIKEGKRLMIWGIIAIFVVWSVGVIVSFIYEDLGLDGAPVEDGLGGTPFPTEDDLPVRN